MAVYDSESWATSMASMTFAATLRNGRNNQKLMKIYNLQNPCQRRYEAHLWDAGENNISVERQKEISILGDRARSPALR